MRHHLKHSYAGHFAVVVCAWGLTFGTLRAASDDVTVTSPDGNVQLRLQCRDKSALSYQVLFRNKPVIDPSRLGITIDGVDLGQGAEVGKAETYQTNQKYPWRGVHAQAINHCNGAKVVVRHANTAYTIEVRAFNDGVAFRHIVPGSEGSRRTPDEATSFTVPAGSAVWYHDFGGHYEGVHARKTIAEVPAGAWAAPPLTIQLPESLGYASITEAALVNYSGLGLQAAGEREFKVRLGHAQPISYPYSLRFVKTGTEEAKRVVLPASVTGAITTPWRVVMVAADLNTLVNSDIVPNFCPPPDPKLFPEGMQTPWIKPGRSVWKFLDGGASTLEEMKEFSRMAGKLGFEYNLIEGFWQKWSDDQLRDLVAESAKHHVKIWLWKHRRQIEDPAERRAFFKHCRDMGIAGVKLDFFDHEAKEVIDLYQAALRDAAEFQLMVDFHGANKPTGEARTWPNEMTREGIYGLEHRKTETWGRHNTTIPFTRLLAGHADYTPVIFGERRKETSWAHQIATAAVLTSPVLIYGAHPKSLLENPAVEIIKSIPSVWDETVVLTPSAIGDIALFARRSGKTWFLAVLNGPAARTVQVPLSFLGAGSYESLLARDEPENAAAIKMVADRASRHDVMTIALRAGGGFIGRFAPAAN